MKQHLWIGSVLAGIIILAMGLAFVVMGANARAEVREGLAAEKIVTSDPSVQLTYPHARAPKDAEIPKVLIDSADEAKAEAEVIRTHSLNLKGSEGKTYAEMARDDPNRETYLKGVALRTALTQAYMAFKIADLVIAMGAILSAIGVGIAALVSPALYWAMHPKAEGVS